MSAPTNSNIERALKDKIKDVLAGISWLDLRPVSTRARNGAEIAIQIRASGRARAELRVFSRAEMRPASFPGWAEARRPAARERALNVLAMPFVSPRLAELCRAAGWGWYDMSGNCLIDLPPVLHIERSGNPPVHRAVRREANLSSAASARVLLALLSPAHAGLRWNQRRLQAQTCGRFPGDSPVSLGLVNKVIRYLREQGFIEDAQDDGFRVRDPQTLLAAWRDAYRFDRHERLSYFTLLKGRQLEDALYRVGLDAGGRAKYAAFSAGERQAPSVRQPRTWLYLDAAHMDAFARAAQAKEVDSGENVVVLVPGDSGVFLSFDDGRPAGASQLGCTDPVQTYVDLSHCGGRGEEAAQAVLEQLLIPAWEVGKR